MNLKKTTKYIDGLLEILKEYKSNVVDPEKSWNKGDENSIIRDMVGMILVLMDQWMKCIMAIRKGIVPKCKHPKKMQAVCDGKKYCMNCNWGL